MSGEPGGRAVDVRTGRGEAAFPPAASNGNGISNSRTGGDIMTPDLDFPQTSAAFSGLPRPFLEAMKTLFEVMDKEKKGWIQIEGRSCAHSW